MSMDDAALTGSVSGQDGTEDQVVKPGRVVIMDYVVRLVTGKIVDSSEKTGSPASFICGSGSFPKPVEEGIVGMSAGDSRSITVHPFYAYGLYDPGKQVLVASERISGQIEAGKIIKVPDQLGITRPAVIREVWNGAIMVDFNHPLAGQVLKFEVTIRQVTPASSTHEVVEGQEVPGSAAGTISAA